MRSLWPLTTKGNHFILDSLSEQIWGSSLKVLPETLHPKGQNHVLWGQHNRDWLWPLTTKSTQFILEPKVDICVISEEGPSRCYIYKTGIDRKKAQKQYGSIDMKKIKNMVPTGTQTHKHTESLCLSWARIEGLAWVAVPCSSIQPCCL